MYFYKDLYVSPRIHNAGGVIRKLRREDRQLTVYVLTIEPDTGQVSFMHAMNLRQKYYRDRPPFIIGIAQGYTDAMELVRKIIEETYSHTGDVNVRAYLFPHGIRMADKEGRKVTL